MKKFINLLVAENLKHTVLFIILNIVLVLAETISITLIPLFIDLIINPRPILLNYVPYFQDLINDENKNNLINTGVIFFIIIFIIKNIFFLSVISYQAVLKAKFGYFLKKKFLKLYIFAPFEIMKSYNTSEILRNTDTETQNYVTNFFNILKFSKDILLLFAIFFLLSFVDFYSTLSVLLFLIICAFLYISFFYSYLNKLGLIKLKAINNVYMWINQTCGAIKEIKISKKENEALEKFSNKVFTYERSKKISEIVSGLPAAFFEMTFIVIILLLIKSLTNDGSIAALPTLSLYIVAFIRMLPIVSRFGSNLATLRTFNPSVILLNREINKLEKYSKLEEQILQSKENLIPFKKDFELKNISFKYNDGEKNIINDLNFKIEKGKCIAFLGKSGAGKTTIINIISGLLKQTSGEILVDKEPINDNIVGWQKNIGLISQENYLLDDTLENNIIFLNDKDSIDKKKLNDAIFYSGVSEFLDELKDGLNTKIGEKGSILSGGQIQRIALARLIYRDPQLLILDEFTNSLDPVNEDFILEKLNQLKNEKNKTYIIISHKIKPLKICDEIIVLDKGRIIEKFNYQDFFNKYHLLYD